MNPAERQTAEGILFTGIYQRSLAHLCIRMGLENKQAQPGHFLNVTPSNEKQKRSITITNSLKGLRNGRSLPGEQIR